MKTAWLLRFWAKEVERTETGKWTRTTVIKNENAYVMEAGQCIAYPKSFLKDISKSSKSIEFFNGGMTCMYKYVLEIWPKIMLWTVFEQKW